MGPDDTKSPEEHAAPRPEYELVDAHPKALVIHCSDPRFQKAFSGFIHNELNLHEGEYIPIVVSGGAAPLSEPLRLPKEFKFVIERILAFLRIFPSTMRIVLINHEDCKHYQSLSESLGNLFLRRGGTVIERQKKDLSAVAAALARMGLPGVTIELYFARIVPGQPPHVVFDRIEG